MRKISNSRTNFRGSEIFRFFYFVSPSRSAAAASGFGVIPGNQITPGRSAAALWNVGDTAACHKSDLPTVENGDISNR